MATMDRKTGCAGLAANRIFHKGAAANFGMKIGWLSEQTSINILPSDDRITVYHNDNKFDLKLSPCGRMLSRTGVRRIEIETGVSIETATRMFRILTTQNMNKAKATLSSLGISLDIHIVSNDFFCKAAQDPRTSLIEIADIMDLLHKENADMDLENATPEELQGILEKEKIGWTQHPARFWDIPPDPNAHIVRIGRIMGEIIFREDPTATDALGLGRLYRDLTGILSVYPQEKKYAIMNKLNIVNPRLVERITAMMPNVYGDYKPARTE